MFTTYIHQVFTKHKGARKKRRKHKYSTNQFVKLSTISESGESECQNMYIFLWLEFYWRGCSVAINRLLISVNAMNKLSVERRSELVYQSVQLMDFALRQSHRVAGWPHFVGSSSSQSTPSLAVSISHLWPVYKVVVGDFSSQWHRKGWSVWGESALRKILTYVRGTLSLPVLWEGSEWRSVLFIWLGSLLGVIGSELGIDHVSSILADLWCGILSTSDTL